MRAVSCLLIVTLLFIWSTVCPVAILAQDESKPPPPSPPPKAAPKGDKSELDDLEGILGAEDKIEAAVIHPYRTANVGSEVSGVIDSVKYEEGERVEKDGVVYEINKERFIIDARRAGSKAKAAEQALQRAKEDLKIQEELLNLGSGKLQDVLKSRADAEINAEKLNEAREDLRLAALNLEACSVRAPFAGYLAVRYKEPFEPVERLGKLFAVVDESKVYAVANVPEKMLPKFKPGAKAAFEHMSGVKFVGAVEKVGALTDPKSLTRKVYVLIDNAKGDLQIGTTGSIGPEE
ncbi:MAG: efflux RND transporter periplasmic adaptor subunit [Deltaproteobacteria bacterium]|nr:efflux RND transporter periplasmic adaptor subunit [Deltaproteobacteria bacterium]